MKIILASLMVILVATATAQGSNCQYSCICPQEINGPFTLTITTQGDCTALEPPDPDKSIIYACAEQCLMQAHELKKYRKCKGTPPAGTVTMEWVKENCRE